MTTSLLRSANETAALLRAGIYSVCSAHPWVLEASLLHAAETQQTLLIEATCNQVNQEGGYTGITPADFRKQVETMAEKAGFPLKRLLFGGDHLGPHPWSGLGAQVAMEKAEEMVRAYVRAGFTKIHLDASMPCAGDTAPLADEVIAQRAAQLCAAAESVRGKSGLVYVIGTEVPTPGGALEEEPHLEVTKREAALHAVAAHHKAFRALGLEDAWQRVVALVVQPGVEFANDSIHDFDAERAVELTQLLDEFNGLVYEAHSTDYQRPEAFSALLLGGFRILKVGPALTYAMRQALYALEAIEVELVPAEVRSNLRATMEKVMLEQPSYWKNHYHGTEKELRLHRVHSYSDRIRYYWNTPEAQQAVSRLMENLEERVLPETLLSDYLPLQYRNVRLRHLDPRPLPLVFDAVREALRPYSDAVALATAR